MYYRIISNPMIAYLSPCAIRRTLCWESGRCKTMLSPPSICWWPPELRPRARWAGLQQNTPYIGDGQSSPPLNLGINLGNPYNGYTNPLLGWWPSTPTHPLSNLARRHAMASSRESCQPNLWHQKSSIGTKSNKSTMGLSGTEKKHEHLFSLKLQCVANMPQHSLKLPLWVHIFWRKR